MKKNGFFFLVLLIISLSCAGTARVKISDITGQPGKFNEQVVKVKGTVVQTFAVPFLKQSLVRVDDGTGTIWVKPRDKVYFKGEKIEVEGTVKVGFTIANKNFGFIIIEKEKKK